MENLHRSSKRFINLNGQILDATTPCLTAGNRGFHYGDGLFESIRLFDGRLLQTGRHLARLRAGLELLHFKGIERVHEAFLHEESLRLARYTGLDKSSRIRFSLFRNEGGLYTPTDDGFGFLVEIDQLEGTGAYQLNEKGWQIGVFSELILPRNGLSPLKTINALPFVCAAIYKREQGLDESLLMNSHGNLVEGSASNLFLVKDGRYFTPAPGEGCTQGVMRDHVIDILKKEDIKVFETAIVPESLEQADEVFLTNAIQGIRWVAAFNQRRFFNQAARKLTGLLNAQATEVEQY